jgi:carbon starvation protein
MPRMKAAVSLLWVLLSIFGALALAHVVGVVNPTEKVNGLWLVVAAGCIYTLAYRFYGRWLARQVVELNNQHVTPAVRLNDGVNFHPTNKVVLFGHHFAAIAGAGGAVRLHARVSVVGDRRGAGRGGAGFYHPRRFDAAQWALAA